MLIGTLRVGSDTSDWEGWCECLVAQLPGQKQVYNTSVVQIRKEEMQISCK